MGAEGSLSSITTIITVRIVTPRSDYSAESGKTLALPRSIIENLNVNALGRASPSAQVSVPDVAAKSTPAVAEPVNLPESLCNPR